MGRAITKASFVALVFVSLVANALHSWHFYSSITGKHEAGEVTDNHKNRTLNAMRRSAVFNETTRTAAIAKHAQEAMERIRHWKAKDSLNLIDVIPLVGQYQMGPATIDNIAVTRLATSANGTAAMSKLHFFFHIPKTGGSGGFLHLRRLVFGRTPQYKAVFRNKAPATTMTAPFVPCRWFPREQDRIERRNDLEFCTLLTSEESGHEESFPHVMTMIRQPRHHVISQYFHCKESYHRREQGASMPDSLQEWLQAWVDYMTTATSESGTLPNNSEKLPKHLQNFQCYDPRNLQSTRLRFQYRMINKDGIGNDHENYSLSDRRLLANAKKDLMQRYQVLGLLERWEETFCLMAIHYSGWVPPSCDCTDKKDDQIRMAPSKALHKDHGVAHHGSSYPLSTKENSLIDQLTRWDQALYQLALEIFEEQLHATEEEYGIRICVWKH